MISADSEAPVGRHVVEIGWMLLGKMDSTDRQAAKQTREALLSYLQRVLPELEWKMPLREQESFANENRERPIELLDVASTEREVRDWDLAFAITEAKLVGYEKPFALAAVSTALGSAVISTAQIDPGPGEGLSDQLRRDRLASRIEAIALHCLGHLSGLEHEDTPTNCMLEFQSVEDVDGAGQFAPRQLEQMGRSLHEIADLRLEESAEWQSASSQSFYIRSAWLNRREILRSIARAKPWLFPFRLSRLAAAAFSALVILVMTAESWELGMSLSPTIAATLSTASIIATTGYVIARQRLLVRRTPRGAREQKVIVNVAVSAIVVLGMTTTYLGLLALTLAAEFTLFDRAIVESWAASVEQIALPQYLTLSAYIASIALVVGALGASFENQQYFRHVTFVDEEV